MSEKVDIKVVEDDEDKQDMAQDTELNQATEAEQDQETQSPSEQEDDVESRLQAAEKKADEYYDRLLRTSAEFDNYKKRATREMRETIKFANEKIIKELLDIVDNLERAIDAIPSEGQNTNPLLEGVQLTLNELLKLLDRHDVKPIQALGEPFDPAFHQAMMQEEVVDKPPNTVVREMQKGYLIHDRLLRPALVGVSKQQQDQTDETGNQQED